MSAPAKIMLGAIAILLVVMFAIMPKGGGSAEAASTPTAQATKTLDDRVAEYVRTYGGQKSQYEVILTLDACDNLDRLLISATESMEHEPDGSPEWRADLGYANAVNDRQLEIDC